MSKELGKTFNLSESICWLVHVGIARLQHWKAATSQIQRENYINWFKSQNVWHKLMGSVFFVPILCWIETISGLVLILLQAQLIS